MSQSSKSKYLAIVIAMITGLFSCTMVSKPQAVAMNNTMAQINDSIFYMGKEFGNMIGDAVTSRNFSCLAAPRRRFEEFIDTSRQRLVLMKDVSGSAQLRKSEIEFLDVEKHMVKDDFIPFEHLTSFATLQEITGLFDKIREDAKVETDKMGNFKREQWAYAKRNGFKLAPNAAER